MLSFTRSELESLTRAFSSAAQYRARLDNYLRAEVSFRARSPVCSGLPIQLHVEPTGQCNLPCPMCPRGRGFIGRTGHLDLASFERVLRPLGNTLASVIFSGFGEPLLNPMTCEMVAMAAALGLPTYMNTNGTVLAGQVEAILDARLSIINISLDGVLDQSTHQYTGSSGFAGVVRGVRSLRAAREQRSVPYPVIHGQFILEGEPSAGMGSLMAWAAEIGVDHVKFKRQHRTMPGEVERATQFPATDAHRMARSRRQESTERPDFMPSACSRPWDSLFLGCTAELGVCSFDPHQLLKLSRGKDVLRAWNCPEIRTVRSWHSCRQPHVGEPCSKCNRLPGYLYQKAATKP